MTIPYTFANAATAIPLAQLDANFASPITLGNVAMTLSNTYTSIGNLTLTNVNIVSGTVPVPTSIANGTSNVSISSSGGNISFASGGIQALNIDTNGFLNLLPATSKIVGGTTAGRVVLANSDQTTYLIAYGSAYGGTQQNTLSFVTNTSYTTTFNANGVIALNGGNVSATGTGIAFPATQSASSDANTLDDYEKGTWTPTDTSGAGLSFTVTGAQYVKVGQMVTAIAIFSYPATANSNASSIGGLPFSTNLNNSTGSILSNNAGAQKMICSGGTTILFFPVNSVNQSANITLSGANIYLSITYRCNS